MEPFGTLGKTLIFIGVFIIIFGLILLLLSNMPSKIRRLPGDIYYERDGFKFYFPITTSILLSIILTIILNVIFHFFRSK